MVKKAVACLGLCIFALLPSCQNASAWYPSASVKVNGSEEFTNPATQAKGLVITLLIHNTGSVSILKSTVTLQVKTGAREYLQTAVSDIRINPGGKAALAVSLNYIDAAETLLADGVVIYDSFFD
jgi:hypothetical protein